MRLASQHFVERHAPNSVKHLSLFFFEPRIDIFEEHGRQIDDVVQFLRAQTHDAAMIAFNGGNSFVLYSLHPIPRDWLTFFKGVYGVRDVFVPDGAKVVMFAALLRSKDRQTVFSQSKTYTARKWTCVSHGDSYHQWVRK